MNGNGNSAVYFDALWRHVWYDGMADQVPELLDKRGRNLNFTGMTGAEDWQDLNIFPHYAHPNRKGRISLLGTAHLSTNLPAREDTTSESETLN